MKWILGVYVEFVDDILDVPYYCSRCIFAHFNPVCLQAATHDVTDATCMRGWLNSPVGLSMEQEIYKATNTVRAYYKVLATTFIVDNTVSCLLVVLSWLQVLTQLICRLHRLGN